MRTTLMQRSLCLLILGLFLSTSLWAQNPAERQQNASAASGTPAPQGVLVCSTSGGANGEDVVVDGGFEAGTPNPNWNEASTNFGTPICDTGACGTGGGTGPFAGTFWAWFGGFSGGTEAASVSQDVTIPTGTAELSFQFEVPACDGAASDFMEVLLDGNQVFEHTCGDGLIAPYAEQTFDVSSFADGGTYTLEFTSTTGGGAPSNFFVDDVSLCAVAGGDDGPGPGEFTAVPTFGLIGAGALILVLLGAGLVVMRRTG